VRGDLLLWCVSDSSRAYCERPCSPLFFFALKKVEDRDGVKGGDGFVL
jgi:hypothetical protein